MEGHTLRTLCEVWIFLDQIFYKNTRFGLKPAFFESGSMFYGYTARSIRHIIAEHKLKYNINEISNFLINHFIESKNEAKKHWKNTKFYILVYSSTDLERQILKNIEAYGYKVIFLDELTDKNLNSIEYQNSYWDQHPNAKAWNLIVPLLSKKLNT